MKKTKLVVIIGLVISVVALTGCIDTDTTTTRNFDSGNIMVNHYDGTNNDDYLLINIFEEGNYTIYISYIDYDEDIHSKTLEFSVCNIPYQYKFERNSIEDYELKVIDKS